jgi:hypothetical protein
MNQSTTVYKNLINLQRAAHATLDGSADGMSVIEAMFIGQACRRFGNEIGRMLDGPRMPKHRKLD